MIYDVSLRLGFCCERKMAVKMLTNEGNQYSSAVGQTPNCTEHILSYYVSNL